MVGGSPVRASSGTPQPSRDPTPHAYVRLLTGSLESDAMSVEQEVGPDALCGLRLFHLRSF